MVNLRWIVLPLLFWACGVSAKNYTYFDPMHGSIALDLVHVTDDSYLYASPSDLKNGYYVTPNTYDYSEYFTEKSRDYVVKSIWELTDRGSVAFYLDDRNNFSINGGHLKVQAHQNFVNLEGLLSPTLWLEILDQFSLYHNYDKRKKTYFDIFEKIMLSPAGFNELDGDLNAVFSHEKSWLTNFLSNLSGNSNEEKISSLKNAIAGDFNGELEAYEWFERGFKVNEFLDTLLNLKKIDRQVGGVGAFFDGLGRVVDLFGNTNSAAKKQKVIALLFMARNLSNVERLCYAFNKASLVNSDPAYRDAWNEFDNDYCSQGGYLQLYKDISGEIKNELLVSNSGVALGILVNAGVNKYLTSRATFGATKLGMLKASIILWSSSEVIEGVRRLSDLNNRALRDALVSHIFNTLSDNIRNMENSELRHIGHVRDILSLKRLQSALMIYIWSDFRAFINANDSFKFFSGPMAWATYAGIEWSQARDSILENYNHTKETAKILYSPTTIISDISGLVELAPEESGDPDGNDFNRAPTPVISVSAVKVDVGETIRLNAFDSVDVDGDDFSAAWQITGPNSFSEKIAGMEASFTPSQSGTYRVALSVFDSVASSTISETISVTDPSQTFFDPEAISRVNVTMGVNRCGDVIQLYDVTLPSGVYWDGPRLWATTYDQDANNPTPQYFMMGLNELPSTDRDYSDEKCANFGLTSERGFNYDFLMDMRNGTYTNSGKVSHGKSWNRLITPGTTVYLAVGAADNYPFDIEQVTLETNVLYDRDGDGVSDNKDAFPDLASEAYDSDGDGVGDNADAFANDSSAWLDSDGDGCPDSITGESQTGLIMDDWPNLSDVCVDSDGDQIDDRIDDAFPDDPSEWADSDGDGTGDNSDAFPMDHAASVDSDEDRYPDFWNPGKSAADSTTGLALDVFPEDPTEWRDSDFDGIGDNADWAVNDDTEWADTDGDGVGDNADAAPNDPGRSTNSSPVLSEIAPLVVFTGTNSLTPVTATDSDGDNITLQTINAPSFLSLTAGELELAAVEGDEGNYEFLIVATDEFGGFTSLRVSTTVEAVVDEDTVPPIVSAPVEGLVLNLSEGNSVVVTDSRVNTFLDSASATDDIDGAVAITNDAPEMFGLGTTTVTFSATDAAGNTGNDTALVTVTSNDNDSDGLPNEFEIENGLEPNDPSDANADLDGDGRTNLEEYRQSTDIAVDDVKPVLSLPGDLVVDSSGPLTEVDLGMATAFDVKDGVIVPTIDNPGPYAPGRHVLTWSATDEAGNTAKSEQIVNVIPIASFTVPQTIYEGTQALVSVTLNGSAADYPVRIPFTVGGTAESAADHDLESGEIIIEVGTSGSMEVSTLDDGIWEGDETIVITMGAVTNAVKGAASSHTITLREENIAPRVAISVTQNGAAASTVFTDAGPVVLTAVVNDPNPGDSHTFDWSMTSNNLVPEEGYASGTFTFDPVSLPEGLFPIAVAVTDSGEGLLDGSDESLIRVEPTAPILSGTEDADGDGIPDALEGAGDSNGNRVPDYLDPATDPGLLPASNVSISMQAESGISLKLGDTAFAVGNNVAHVTPDNVMNHGGEAGRPGLEAADSSYQYPGGIFDFIAFGVEVGGSVRIVIPQTSAIPADAVYRKYKRESGWSDFVKNANNEVSSAPGSLGNCPAPGDSSYTPSLVQGNHCVQLTIQDGGLNDADGTANGVVRDPGGVAVRSITEPVIALERMPVNNTTFNRGGGEMVVLGFMFLSDSTDAELNQLTFSAAGEIDETADVGVVRLYRDDNKNGIPEAAERVAEVNYDSDNGDIIFDLPEAYQLQVGETHFLVTYQF